VPLAWLDIERDEQARHLISRHEPSGVTPGLVPRCRFRDECRRPAHAHKSVARDDEQQHRLAVLHLDGTSYGKMLAPPQKQPRRPRRPSAGSHLRFVRCGRLGEPRRGGCICLEAVAASRFHARRAMRRVLSRVPGRCVSSGRRPDALGPSARAEPACPTVSPVETANLDAIYGSRTIPWSRPRDLLAVGAFGPETPFFLGTVRPDGRPHAAGIGVAWYDGDRYFQCAPKTRKARNVAANPACATSGSLPA
jgi:hypothetical protein